MKGSEYVHAHLLLLPFPSWRPTCSDLTIQRSAVARSQDSCGGLCAATADLDLLEVLAVRYKIPDQVEKRVSVTGIWHGLVGVGCVSVHGRFRHPKEGLIWVPVATREPLGTTRGHSIQTNVGGSKR
jgi:hypothetical protein